MVAWFSKPVIASVVALTTGLLVIGSSFLISRAEHKSNGASTAPAAARSAAPATAPSSSPLADNTFPTDMREASSTASAPIAPHSPSSTYSVIRVLSKPVSSVTWTYNTKDSDTAQPVNEVVEMHSNDVQYEFEIRLPAEKIGQFLDPQIITSDGMSIADFIEVWCPKSMKPLPQTELIKYTGGAKNAEYKAALSEALSFEQAQQLFSSEGGQSVVVNKSLQLPIEGKDYLSAFAAVACPQLADRPEPPHSVPAYNPLSATEGYRCNVEIDGTAAPHKVALSADVFDTNSHRIGFKDYPTRIIPGDHVLWNQEVSDYTPQYYMSDWLITSGWSHPFFPLKNADGLPTTANTPFTGAVDVAPQFDDSPELSIQTSTPPVAVQFDSRGFPVNPCGRTGLSGRGLLGAWGPNSASDPVVTRSVKRVNAAGETKYMVEVLLVSRPEPVSADIKTKKLAIPGGMSDLIAYDKIKKKQESGEATAGRELAEETGMVMDFKAHPDVLTIYKGYADDPRNTDNAWMQTEVIWKHLAYMPLYDNKEQLNKHRRATKFLNKISGDLKDNKLTGNDELLNQYLHKTLPDDVTQISEKYGNCLPLNSDLSATCADKLMAVAGVEITMDNKAEFSGLGLLKAYAGHVLGELQELPGWREAFDRMKSKATRRKMPIPKSTIPTIA